MSWVNWSRRSVPAAARERASLGIELSADVARAAFSRAAHNRIMALDEPNVELALAISMQNRAPQVGRAGIGLVRKLPHLICTEFLPFLGQAREWKGGRHTLNAEDALALTFHRLSGACSALDDLYVALPSYFSRGQAAKLITLANKYRLSVKGTVANHLALVADRVYALLAPPTDSDGRVEGIVPMHRPDVPPLPADVLVIDADNYALTCSLIRCEPEQLSVLAATTLQHLGVKHWKNRLLDAFADRCVRVCRRDPRDSADAEQALYEQIDAGLDSIRSRQHVTLSLRAAHWYQDLHLQPEDFEICCSTLIRASVDGIRELQNSAGAAIEPPRAVWMTHAAGRLPGLARSIYLNMAERTSVGVLRPEAMAIAVANLGDHWPAAGHLDSAIPHMLPALDNKPQSITLKTLRS